MVILPLFRQGPFPNLLEGGTSVCVGPQLPVYVALRLGVEREDIFGNTDSFDSFISFSKDS